MIPIPSPSVDPLGPRCLRSDLKPSTFFVLFCVLVWFVSPTATIAQLIGGQALAGMEWDKHTIMTNFYHADFAAVAFDHDFDGQEELYLMGGQFNGVHNAVRRSVGGSPEDLGNAPWSARSQFEAVVYDGRIWVFAGKETANADVWFTYDGETWSSAPDAPWPVRGNYKAEVFNGKIWLMGGFDGQDLLNDVWSFDGTNWQQEADAAWAARDGFTTAVLGGELYVIGGRGNDGTDDYVLTDVWKTADGATWTQATAEMELGPIREHATVVFDDRIWILGGTISTDDTLYDPAERVSITDEVWYSFDGSTWTCASEYGQTAWPRRRGHEAVVFRPAKWDNAHSQYVEFPQILIIAGTNNNNQYSKWIWTDRRDHELTVHTSPEFVGPLTVQSPRGRQTERVTSSSIIVEQNLSISDVNVRLHMDHPNWQDITLMRLVLDYTDEQGNPQQRKMPFVYNWKAGAGTFDSVWTDEGGLLMADIIYGETIQNPQPRSKAPRGADMNWFDGFPTQGTWTLEITDSAKGNDGILFEWSLEFRGMPISANPGINVSPNDGLVTTESGGTDIFDVSLASEPSADVTIGISSSDTTEGTIDKTSLTFTPANWDTPQSVTVTGVDDPIEDGDVPYSIVTDPAESTDPNYNGLDANDVSILNEDDDLPPGGGSETYDATDIPQLPQLGLDIPDNNPAGTSSTIGNVPDLPFIGLTVSLEISHSRPSDLEVWLVPDPDSTDQPVQLFNYTGQNDVTGDFTSSLGDWTLEIYDLRKRREGTLKSWSITIDY